MVADHSRLPDNEECLHRAIHVTLDDVLSARDNRAIKQRDMVVAYRCPLISMTMNMPGRVKRTPLSSYFFHEELERLKHYLKAMGATVEGDYISTRPTGDEAILAVSGLSACLIKNVAVFLEERTGASRLLDIDVLDEQGHHVTRASIGREARKCLFCEKPAKICSRARTHPLTDLEAETSRRLEEAVCVSLAERVVTLASQASAFELLVHPKPGLVTPFDRGSHRDMDGFTFAKSQASLLTYYKRVFTLGWGGLDTDERIDTLRLEGMEAEQVMLDATNGVNTHRGWVYLAGILLASFGLLCANYFKKLEVSDRKEDVSELFSRTAAKIARSLEKSLDSLLFESVRENMVTHRSMAVDHDDSLCCDFSNLVGIRKEAVLGFPSLFNIGYPVVMRAQLRGEGENEAGQRAILALLSVVDDTTLCKRAGITLARHIRQCARATIDCQNEKDEVTIVSQALSISGEVLREAILSLSRCFSEHGVSCGGVADLLAGSYLVRDLNGILRDLLH